jgi:uncharacterized protein (DUF2235 family)
MSLLRRFLERWFFRKTTAEQTPVKVHRGAQDHVVILDGTLSSLEPGYETNAGQLYKLLQSLPPLERPQVRYEAGVQWRDWRSTRDVLEGRGINRQIRRSYGVLASRLRKGDRIFLFGYSRGAYAVRSLAGLLDQVGLLKPAHATERNIRQAYRLYQGAAGTDAIREFQAAYCYSDVEIQMVGVWDTVKALGLRLPILWRFTDPNHAFHSHHLGHSARHGYQALALDERRRAFEPVLWECPPGWEPNIQQMWFCGSHGDIGGQVNGFAAARPLANIPFVWVLDKAEALNLALPKGWRAGFPQDVNAPSVGSRRGWGLIFLARSKRVVGRDSSERIHESVPDDHPMQIPLARLHDEAGG